ncbi:hypothetical protein [Vibrio splendidus]|uniref:hypothetical protein n=1 Tax=Vibrio splendidus TaxID=29497 RepID=UPI002158B4CD|nr:hypothetical protein [Vibrio splendidus]
MFYVGTRLSGHVRRNDCRYLRKENGECGIEGRSASLSSHIRGGVALIPLLIEWQWPTWYELVLLVLVGVISSIGQWFGVTAYKCGEASIVSNIEYSQRIYS